MKKIIERDRTIIPACDVPLETYEEIVKGTGDVDGIGGYKIGPALTGRPGYDKIVETTRKYTDKPLIIDAQKWGTDIPDTARNILTPVKESGINAVILFPESGPITEYEWIKTAQDLDLGVIVGGEMTHNRYLSSDGSNSKDKNYTEIFRELGIDRDIPGFIREFAPEDIYEIAARMGVTNFVVPGNKPDRIAHYRSLVESCGVDEPVFYAPGFVAQGGEISDAANVAGNNWHAIVGRGIYKANDKKRAALEMTSKL